MQSMNRLLLALLICANAYATTYHVFPAGADLQRLCMTAHATTDISQAIRALEPGDTVFMRAGTHHYTATIHFDKSGTPEARICLMAYPGETAVFDFTGNAGPGMVSTASYTDYIDKTFKGASGNGLLIEGSNNRILRCKFFENGNSGLQIEGSNNTITNCDSYYNKDSEQGQADGFAPKLDVGSGNKFIGCRAWQNSDDGWDGYLKSSKDVSQTFENCWAFKNGYLKDGSVSQGNGNGFKTGSETGTHNWTMKNCIAWGNLSKGFDQNHNRGSLTLYNCNAMDNVRYDFSEYEAIASGKSAALKNCLQFRSQGSDFSAWRRFGAFVQVANCSWMGSLKADASDFESINPSELSSPRKADGSLPDIKFLHLKQGSDLIDAGVNVGIPFKGRAPDIGAFESEHTTGAATGDSKRREGVRWDVSGGAGSLRVEFDLPKAQRILLSLHELSGKQVRSSIVIRGIGGKNFCSINLERRKAATAGGMYLLTARGESMAPETKRVFISVSR